MSIIGIDIGGTSVKFAVLNDDLTICSRQQKTVSTLLADLVSLVSSLIEDNCPEYIKVPIGIACAGEIDQARGLVTADNLNLDKAPLGPLLEERLGRSVLLVQDAHAALLGEWQAGSLRNENNALYLTFGAGVGGAAIIDGVPYRETRPLACEFGHMITHAGGLRCICGEYGCYEQYASAAALVRRSRGHDSARSVIEAAQQGDHAILPIWQAYIDDVCIGIVSLLTIFTPEILTIGGGISEAGPFLLNSIKAGLARRPTYLRYYSHIRIRLAQLGNDAGLTGAAIAAKLAAQGKRKGATPYEQ